MLVAFLMSQCCYLGSGCMVCEHHTDWDTPAWTCGNQGTRDEVGSGRERDVEWWRPPPAGRSAGTVPMPFAA